MSTFRAGESANISDDGHATYRVKGEEIDTPAGTFLYVPDPATVRGAVACEAGTAMLIVGAEPGAVFKPSDWDTEQGTGRRR